MTRSDLVLFSSVYKYRLQNQLRTDFFDDLKCPEQFFSQHYDDHKHPFLSHGCGISMGADLLSSSTKLLQCRGAHDSEGRGGQMKLLFDTPLPLHNCEIWLALVSALPAGGTCVYMCVCVRADGRQGACSATVFEAR